jgi:hypothetical protein
MGTAGFDERKAAESVTHFVSILDLQVFPIRVWNFDRPCLPRQVSGLFSNLAAALIFAE